MPPLPIIRLERTSGNNATLTEDPLRATATLYSFLRSVPTSAEVALAMDDFRAALQRRWQQDEEHAHRAGFARADGDPLHSSSHALVHLTPEEEDVRQRLQAAVMDRVLHQEPFVSPEWCRRHSRWREIFQRAAADSNSDRAATPHRSTPVGEDSRVSSSTTAASSSPPPPSVGEERLRVQTESLKQYMSPYEAYSAEHGLAHPRPQANVAEATVEDGDPHIRHPQPAAGGTEGDEPSEAILHRSGSTQPPESGSEGSLRHLGQQYQQEESLGDEMEEEGVTHHGYGAADAGPSSIDELDSASSSPTSSRDAPSEGASFSAAAMPPLCPTATAEGAIHHPLLSLIARQAQQQQQQPTEAARDDNSALSSSPSSSAILRRCREVQAVLASTRDNVVSAMQAYEEQEGCSIWSPAFTYMKNSANFIAELQERAQAAENLCRVEAYEQETVERAQSALLAEVMSMRLLLRDVHRAVDDAAAEYVEGHLHEDEAPARRESEAEHSTKTMDAALMSDLIPILAPFTGEDQEHV